MRKIAKFELAKMTKDSFLMEWKVVHALFARSNVSDSWDQRKSNQKFCQSRCMEMVKLRGFVYHTWSSIIRAQRIGMITSDRLEKEKAGGVQVGSALRTYWNHVDSLAHTTINYSCSKNWFVKIWTFGMRAHEVEEKVMVFKTSARIYKSEVR